ncbi:MAG: MBL fold metallo-hydrolase [Chloroflexi bacterium]|nr:MBL fold metallo-hydrolase [Chloroflexota bacterium]
MSSTVQRVETLRDGDRQGNGALLKLSTVSGHTLWAIGVPQDPPSPTGPTWVYVLDLDGVTLVDAGSAGSFDALASGLKELGIGVKDVRRVILTHGHGDHDGATLQLVQASGADLWAHEMYAYLLSVDPWGIQRRSNPFLQQLAYLHHPDRERRDNPPQEGRYQRHQQHQAMRRQLHVTHLVKDGDRSGGFTFYYTPGHSPDELTISLDGVLFTGDHVLPEITPHPTVLASYPESVSQHLPPSYRDASNQYGLATFLRSLRRVAALGEEQTVLPAHRLLSKGRLNLLTGRRALDIVQHHRQRMRRIVALLDSREHTVDSLTRTLFSYRELHGGNYYAAYTEVVAHLELLAQWGDVELRPDAQVRWLGTERFQEAVWSL